jgi:hypothetical protein
VQTNLARSHLAVRGFTPEAERTIRETLDRFEAAGDVRQRFSTLRSLASSGSCARSSSAPAPWPGT